MNSPVVEILKDRIATHLEWLLQHNEIPEHLLSAAYELQLWAETSPNTISVTHLNNPLGVRVDFPTCTVTAKICNGLIAITRHEDGKLIGEHAFTYKEWLALDSAVRRGVDEEKTIGDQKYSVETETSGRVTINHDRGSRTWEPKDWAFILQCLGNLVARARREHVELEGLPI